MKLPKEIMKRIQLIVCRVDTLQAPITVRGISEISSDIPVVDAIKKTVVYYISDSWSVHSLGDLKIRDDGDQ